MKIEPQEAWAIRHWRQGIYVSTVRSTRREAIRYFKKGYGVSDKMWRTDRRFGIHQCVRVTITVS